MLTPALIGIGKGANLPNASTFCGRCESVCPMKIPLPKLMRHWREAEFQSGAPPWTQRTALAAWAALARRPRLYHLAMRFAAATLGAFGGAGRRFRRLPLAGGWTRHRDLAAPEGRTFQQLWAETQRGVPK